MREQIIQAQAAHDGHHATHRFRSRMPFQRGEGHARRCCFLLVLSLLGVLDSAAAERVKPVKPAKAPKEIATGPWSKKNDPSDALFGTNSLIRTFNVEVSGAELAALQKDVR